MRMTSRPRLSCWPMRSRCPVACSIWTGRYEPRRGSVEVAANGALSYQAVTYGDLAKLVADLPAASPQRGPRLAPAPAASPAAAAKRGVFADLPAPLKVLWTIWLAAVSINVVVWVLVVGTSGHFIYPWPLWVAGPYGAALLAVSVPVVHSRRNRRLAAPLPPPGEAGSRRQLGSER
jgi:hypothetical protein